MTDTEQTRSKVNENKGANVSKMESISLYLSFLFCFVLNAKNRPPDHVSYLLFTQGEEISMLITRYIHAIPGPPRMEEPPKTPPAALENAIPGDGTQPPQGEDPSRVPAMYNPDDVNHLRNPRASYIRESSHSGSSNNEDQFKIHLPPDENENQPSFEIVDGKKTYSKQRFELAQHQEQQTSRQRQQHEQIQQQLKGRFVSQYPQSEYRRQPEGSNGYVPNGNAGLHRVPSKTRGGGDILRRGLPNSNKPNRNRPMSMPPQPVTRHPDGLKIKLPPSEY